MEAIIEPRRRTPANRERATESLVSLASRAADGDDDAFETLYQRLDGGLRRFFVRRGSAAETTEELAQRTWVDVWQALRGGRYDSTRAAFTTFLYAVGYKVWLQFRRQLRIMPDAGADPDTLLAVAASATLDSGDAVDLAEQLEYIRACLRPDGPAGLTADELDVLRGLVAGESERALARELGAAASTINARKASAINKLRTRLSSGDWRRAERDTRPER